MKLFGRNITFVGGQRAVPKETQAPNAADVAADTRATGFAIEDLTNRALADMRRTPAPARRFSEQVSEGAVIESMVNAAMPAVARDAANRQRAIAETIAREQQLAKRA
jgi:hypothetical protein